MGKAIIAYVILTWNSEKYIKNCLESVLNIKSFYNTIILVDNGSADNTLQIISEYEKKCKSLKNCDILAVRLHDNLGTTVSRNIGIKRIPDKADYVCILDSDTQINEKAIICMINALKENSQNGIVGPVMKDLNGVQQVSGRRIPTVKMKLLKVLPGEKNREKAESLDKYPKEYCVGNYPVGYLMSACWFMKKSIMDEVGLLDENIFYAPEDVEYCVRMWKQGKRVLYCQDAEIVHEWQRISKKRLLSKHNFEHIKGLLYFFKKYKFFFNSSKIEKYVK